MATNPYESFAAGQDPLEVTSATPVKLENLLRTLGPEKLELAPAPGKWSVRDILAHLADCEIVFSFRLRQALAEDHPVIQPFDQDKWAATYAGYDARMALAVFSALRQWNLAFLKPLSDSDLDRTLNHPERGDMKMRVILDTMAGHDVNHLRQVERLLA